MLSFAIWVQDIQYHSVFVQLQQVSMRSITQGKSQIKLSVKFRLNFLQPCSNLGFFFFYVLALEENCYYFSFFFFEPTHTLFQKKEHQERLHSVALRIKTLEPDPNSTTYHLWDLQALNDPFMPQFSSINYQK